MNTAIMLEGILARLQAIEGKLKKPKPKKIPRNIELKIYRDGYKNGLAHVRTLTQEERFDIGKDGYEKGFLDGYDKGFAEAKIWADPLTKEDIHKVRLCAATS